jgi:hypothetical protein
MYGEAEAIRILSPVLQVVLLMRRAIWRVALGMWREERSQ